MTIVARQSWRSSSSSNKSAIVITERRQAPVVENQDVGFGQGRHELHIATIAFGERKLLEEPREAQVEHRPALAAGLMPQGARQPGFTVLMTLPSWG